MYDVLVSKQRIKSFLPHLMSVIKLLTPKDRMKLLSLGIVNFFLSFLDLAALVLIGVVTSISLSQVSPQSGNQLSKKISNIDLLSGINPRSVIFVLGGVAAFFLVFKTLTSAILTRKIIGFLTIREAQVSSAFIRNFLNQSPIIQAQLSPPYIAGVALSGANSAITVTLGQLVIAVVEFFSIFLLFAGVSFVNPVVTVSTVLYFGLLATFSIRFLANKIKLSGEISFVKSIASAELIQNAISTSKEIYTSNSQRKVCLEYENQRMQSYAAVRSKAFIGLIPKYILEIGLVVGGILIGSSQIAIYDFEKALTGVVIFLALTARLVPSLLKIQNAILEMKAASKPTENFLYEFSRSGDTAENLIYKSGNVSGLSLKRNLTNEFIGKISVRDLEIIYPNNQFPSLQNLNLEIENGSFVAIVGPSGAGKTTLVDALLGIALPSKGGVEISGVPSIEAISQWPDKIRYVPQDVQLVSGSILTNICWPLDPEIYSEEKISSVLELVELTEWVAEKPAQLSELIGFGGSNLSGGQKQRLGIARALLSNPSILILDESTSSMDTLTESLIADRILGKMEGLTRVVIAHRLSTVKFADKLIYIENGRKITEGTFEQLRKSLPQFEELVRLSEISK